tara:strand:+ start:1517 stop:1666 length:150 start_codon:yes stop_codon:yes gene_type:complete
LSKFPKNSGGKVKSEKEKEKEKVEIKLETKLSTLQRTYLVSAPRYFQFK